MIVDSGGGTIDITCHQVLGKDEGLREIAPPSGGDWGSTYVNENFEKFLRDVFGSIVDFNEIKATSEWLTILDNFEDMKLNCTLSDLESGHKSLNISLISGSIKSGSVEENISEWNMKSSYKLSLSRGFLRIPIPVVHGFFKPLLEKIIGHIESLLEEESLAGISHMFLVGGFSESPLLQQTLIKTFEERGIQVKVPSRPSFAVISGAVQLQLSAVWQLRHLALKLLKYGMILYMKEERKLQLDLPSIVKMSLIHS